MSIISRLFKRFREFGGIRLILTYIRIGAIGEFVRQGFYVIWGKKHFGEANQAVQASVIPQIQRQYLPLLEQLADKYNSKKLQHRRCNRIWFCWLQGIDNAPEIVRICLNSLYCHLPDYDIVVLSENNIGDYVEFPDVIIQKYNQGIIPKAHFTDLLRLELLNSYGGTWIDATILCTGFESQRTKDIKTCLNADLFFFQHLEKDDSRYHGISNWLVSASSNQIVLLILRDMLYQYWNDYNCVVAYFIFHIFFAMIEQQMPEEIKKMPRKNNRYCFYLEHRLGDKFDEDWTKELINRSCFHKLSGRLWKEAEGKANTFLCEIEKRYNPA